MYMCIYIYIYIRTVATKAKREYGMLVCNWYGRR